MTTSTLPKRFTVQVGDHLIELPEADTRDEALRKAGLTPRHWPEKPAIKHQVNKGIVETPTTSKCVVCGNKLDIIRKTRRFCSGKCRIQHFRNAKK